MKKFSAKEYRCNTLKKAVQCNTQAYPYIRSNNGDKIIYGISPCHGRSYVVDKIGERYIVSKGNGLSYSQYKFLYSGESYEDAWGLLLKQDAMRDFTVGQEIASLGIKTNAMEYLIEVDEVVTYPTGRIVKPILLQYSVECPYRICDYPFVPSEIITQQVKQWESLNNNGYMKSHLIAAEVLISNLSIMHLNKILYNAFHIQNYTWALELLDFELTFTPSYPYASDDYNRHVCDLFQREIIQTYEIINYIAWCLSESVEYEKIDKIFKSYSFDLSDYALGYAF